MNLTGEVFDAYLQEAVDGDGRAGVRLALDLLDSGVPSDEIIVSLLGAAQREAGERWLRNEWSVADEHLVSGVTQKALDAAATATETPGAATSELIMVACAEGDWHSLPGQMFAEMLRSHGFGVAFLGASTPVDHLATLMRRLHPDALAVTCNLPLFFGGVTRFANVAHRAGIPVVVGGRALGTGPDRASRLGADAWAPGIDEAAAILRSWQLDPLEISPEPTLLDPALLELDWRAAEIAAAGSESLVAAYPPLATYDRRQRARTDEDLAYITQFVAAARMVDDPAVLTDMLDWLRTLLANRGIPATAVSAGLAALAPLISRLDAEAGRLVLDVS